MSKNIADKIIDFYDQPLKDILESKCKDMSRFEACDFLNKEMNESFKPSNLWGAAKKVNFSFSGKKKKRIRKISEIAKEISSFKEEEEIGKQEGVSIPITYKCRECNFEFKSILDNPKTKLLVLKAKRCKQCKKIGKLKANYIFKGKKYTKAIVPWSENPSVLKEEFVDDNLNPIQVNTKDSIENSISAKDRTSFII